MSMQNGTSAIELLGSLESELTAHQIAQFKQAFYVFDVNHDGRITTNEMFEVLKTLGNDVSEDRKRKIHAAVAAVDLDNSKDLDFAEFIQFMKIMDEHNKSEQASAPSSAPKEAENAAPAMLEERATWKYYSTVQIEIKLRGSRNWFMWFLALAFTLYNLVHAVFIQVIVGGDWNTLEQNPGDNQDKNYFAQTVQIIRYVNYGNFLIAFLILVNESAINFVYDALEYNGFKRSVSNLLKYVIRPIFILNAASSVLFILGIAQPNIEPTNSSLETHWEKWAPALAQIVSAYFCLSFFLYFDTFVEPATIWYRIAVTLLDIFVFNWLLVLFRFVKNALALLLLPFLLIYTILSLSTSKCCPGLFDVSGPRSKTSVFLRYVAYLCG